MKRTIRALTSASVSIRVGDRSQNECSLIQKNSFLGSEALEDRDDRTILLEALIHLKQAKRRPDEAILLNWNDIKDEWE
jgi:hypothetical protein